MAERWLEAVWNTVFFLRDHPEAGRLRRDLRHAGVRSWLVADFRRWTIFYRIKRLEGGERDLRARCRGEQSLVSKAAGLPERAWRPEL